MIFVRQKEKERLFPDSTIMAAINTRKKHRTGYLFRAERGEPPRGREARRPSTDPLRTRPCPVAVGRDVLIAPPSARAANPRTALARVHSARALPCGAIGISRPTGHAAPSHTHRATRPCPVAVGKMRTTCFEPYQAYWQELFFDNRKCNRIRLANRLTTRSRFGNAARDQPVHKPLREKKKAIPP